MLRFNTFFTVVITFFAFLFALGSGFLTAVRLTTPEPIAAQPAAVLVIPTPQLSGIERGGFTLLP